MIQVCHPLTLQRQRTGPLCALLPPLYQVDFFFFIIIISFCFMELYTLPFAFVALWKHTEEINPNVAHPKTGMYPLSTFFILGRLEVP